MSSSFRRLSETERTEQGTAPTAFLTATTTDDKQHGSDQRPRPGAAPAVRHPAAVLPGSGAGRDAGPAGLSGHLLRAECEPLQPPALLPAPIQVPAHPYRRLPVGRPAALDPSGSALHRCSYVLRCLSAGSLCSRNLSFAGPGCRLHRVQPRNGPGPRLQVCERAAAFHLPKLQLPGSATALSGHSEAEQRLPGPAAGPPPSTHQPRPPRHPPAALGRRDTGAHRGFLPHGQTTAGTFTRGGGPAALTVRETPDTQFDSQPVPAGSFRVGQTSAQTRTTTGPSRLGVSIRKTQKPQPLPDPSGNRPALPQQQWGWVLQAGRGWPQGAGPEPRQVWRGRGEGAGPAVAAQLHPQQAAGLGGARAAGWRAGPARPDGAARPAVPLLRPLALRPSVSVHVGGDKLKHT